jgi:hypothetical protein
LVTDRRPGPQEKMKRFEKRKEKRKKRKGNTNPVVFAIRPLGACKIRIAIQKQEGI